jgi:hypothetical protein
MSDLPTTWFTSRLNQPSFQAVVGISLPFVERQAKTGFRHSQILQGRWTDGSYDDASTVLERQGCRTGAAITDARTVCSPPLLERELDPESQVTLPKPFSVEDSACDSSFPVTLWQPPLRTTQPLSLRIRIPYLIGLVPKGSPFCCLTLVTMCSHCSQVHDHLLFVVRLALENQRSSHLSRHARNLGRSSRKSLFLGVP